MLGTISQIGPGHTPKIVGKLILAIIVISLFSALWESLFTQLLGVPPLQPFIALSKSGISHFFIWQFVSYLFVVNSYGGGIQLFYLIYLLFTMYFLWVMGSEICAHGGRRQFLELFFTSGIISGIVGIFFLWLFGTDTMFAGPAPALLALFTAWAFLNPEIELLLFFVLPLRIKWLFVFVLGAIFLINLSQLNFILLFFYMTAITIGYLFSLFAWELGSPFPITNNLDRTLIRLKDKISWKRFFSEDQKSSKIIQLFSGKPRLDDDAFIDEMLSKISSEGQDSLSWSEKKRMDDIAKKRSK